MRLWSLLLIFIAFALPACSNDEPIEDEPIVEEPAPDEPFEDVREGAPDVDEGAPLGIPSVADRPPVATGGFGRTEKLVGAVYFVWYRQGKTRNEGHQKSVLGLYDSEDPKVIAQHLTWMRDTGVDFIAVSYWGYDENKDMASGRQARIIKYLLNEVGKYDMKLCIMLEGAWDKKLDIPLGQILRHFSSHPNYLKYDDRPVLFPFWRVRKHITDDSKWAPWINKFYICQDTFNTRWQEAGFGAWRFTMIYDRDNWEGMLAKQRAFRKQRNYLLVVPVIPGYDSRHAGKLGEKTDHLYFPRGGFKFYDRTWEMALKADPDWIMVTSFNGFPEWHGIEPSVPEDKFGYQYLERTKHWIEKFKSMSR